MIFERLKADADLHLGQNTTECTLSVPSNFNVLQRTAVVNSAKLAGLNAVCIFPSAALSALAGFSEV